MNDRCVGRKDGNAPCKNKVPRQGDYCRYHIHQKKIVNPCNCFLNGGSRCPYEATANGFCEFHLEPRKCQGKTILGSQCLLAISNGNYCYNCKSQEVIPEQTRASIDKTRALFAQQIGPIAPIKKATSVQVLSSSPAQLIIPEDLKKVTLEKPEHCVVCLEELVDRKTYRSIGCGHYFHLECLSKCNEKTCPLCRRPIDAKYLPSWVMDRIKYNMKEKKKSDVQQETQELIRLAGTMAMQGQDFGGVGLEQLLDMNSSEEEDFQAHLENGNEMELIETVDASGRRRLAFAVLGMGRSPPGI